MKDQTVQLKPFRGVADANEVLVRTEVRGPQLFVSRTAPEFMAELFKMEVPEIYEKMSPFYYAHKINEPILLIHGEADDNSGTFPIQSERLYMAIKGHGGMPAGCGSRSTCRRESRRPG